MNEPGLKVQQVPSGEPLLSEVSMVFEPLTFPIALLLGKGFQKEVTDLLGPSAVVTPRYSEHEIRDLAESLATHGKQIDPKRLAGLTPKGLNIRPGGQFAQDSRTITVNRLSIGDMGFDCNVAGTSEDAKAVIKAVINIIGRLAGSNHNWDYYHNKLSFTRYGTITVSQLPVPLRKLLSADAERLLQEVIEKELASHLAPERAGMQRPEVAFTKVMIHEIDAWVTVVEADGTMNRCRLDLSCRSDEDIANHRVHVISELDYEAHERFVAALREMLQEGTPAGSKSA